jgi:hypothetical protein
MTQTALAKPIALPLVTAATADFVASLTTALGLPRDILASDEEIAIAW